MNKLKVKRLNKDATLPKRSYPFDAGLDLSSIETVFIPTGKTFKIHTGIAIEVPEGYYAHINDRSGCALKGLKISGGVVDCGYNGEVCVILTNLNNTSNETTVGLKGYIVNKYDRIAQIVLHKIELPEVLEVDELSNSERGSNGYNSSGR